MKHEILIADTGERYLCDDSESVLGGMARLGRKGIPLGCRGGGCGVCKVAVVDGRYEAGAMSRQHISEADLRAGHGLACQIRPSSDLTVKVVGGLRKAACRPLAAGPAPNAHPPCAQEPPDAAALNWRT